VWRLTSLGENALSAADDGGVYLPPTSSMRFASPIPDEFPFLDFASLTTQDIAPLAALLEEFAHRFQFETMHFGCLYRLACLIQTQHCLSLLRWLAHDPSRQLPTPWMAVNETDPDPQSMLEDIRALELVKRLLFGLSIGGHLPDAYRGFERTKELVHAFTPLRLRYFGVWEGLADFYDESGVFKLEKTTRAILESHASAYAFALLREAAPAAIQPEIGAFIAINRRGLYATVEQMSQSAVQGEGIDLHAVLRLGDYAMDGALFDIPTVPPPGDYVASMLPYARYRLVLEDLPRVNAATKRLGANFSLADAVETVVTMRSGGLHADPDMLDDATMRQGRLIQLKGEIVDLEAWLEREEEENPLEAYGLSVRREIARTCATMLRGSLPFHINSAKFAPNLDRLEELCMVCDLPLIEYPDGFELFRCYAQDIDSTFMAWRMVVQGMVETAGGLINDDIATIGARAEKLEPHSVPSIFALAQAYGFDTAQLT